MKRLALVALLLLGLPLVAIAAPPQGVPDSAVPAMTLDQAKAALGAPSYEHRCTDGTTTVAWKHAAHRVPPTFASVRHPMETLVVKFAPAGQVVWVREVR